MSRRAETRTVSWVWPVARTGFRQQMTYGRAMAISAVASVAYSAVRLSVLRSLYEGNDSVAGLTFENTVAWAAMTGAFFAMLWVPWMNDLPETIRSGAVISDLVRPVNPFFLQVGHQVGRLAALALVRVVPVLLVAVVVLPMPAPAGPGGWGLLVASLVLLTVSSVANLYLLGAVAFFTPDYHVWLAFAFYTMQLIGGVLIPIEFIPGLAGTLVRFGPGMAFFASPIRIINNVEPAMTLLVQAVWTIVFGVAAYSSLHLGRKKLVIFGG